MIKPTRFSNNFFYGNANRAFIIINNYNFQQHLNTLGTRT